MRQSAPWQPAPPPHRPREIGGRPQVLAPCPHPCLPPGSLSAVHWASLDKTYNALRSGPCPYGFGRENHILLFTLHCFLPDSSAWEFSWPAARDSGFDCRALSSPAPACSVSQRQCRALSGRAGPSEVPFPGPQVFHPQDGRGYPCLQAAWENNGVPSPR